MDYGPWCKRVKSVQEAQMLRVFTRGRDQNQTKERLASFGQNTCRSHALLFVPRGAGARWNPQHNTQKILEDKSSFGGGESLRHLPFHFAGYIRDRASFVLIRE